LQPQDGVLAAFELETEVGGKALLVAVYLLIETLHRNPVDLSQRGIKNNSLMAQNRDTGFDRNYGNFLTSCWWFANSSGLWQRGRHILLS